MTRDEAYRLRAIVEKAMSEAALDAHTAFDGLVLYHDVQKSAAFWDGHLITTGTRMRWGKRLLAAMVDVWAYPENNPDNAPNLWEEILYEDGYRVLLGPISASNPVQPGEMCWEQGDLYKCVYHTACTYRPSEYKLAWEKVDA